MQFILQKLKSHCNAVGGTVPVWNEQLLSEDIQPSQRQNLRHIQRQWQTQRQKQFQWWNEQHWNEVVPPSPWEMSLPFRNPVCCAFLVGPLSLSLFVGGLQFVNVCPSRVIDIRRNSELESKKSKTLLVEKSICQRDPGFECQSQGSQGSPFVKCPFQYEKWWNVICPACKSF